MSVLNKIDKKLNEQFDYMVTEPEWKVVSDERVFTEMANLIMSLEPDQLDDIQMQKVIDIFNEMQAEAELDEEVKAKRSSTKAKQYLKKYYRTQKVSMKKKKKEFDQSIKGKVRKKKEPIMAKGRKTPTGRHKVEYNV